MREEILCLSPYSVRMRENTDQKNSEYEHFFSCVYDIDFLGKLNVL